MVGLGGKLRLNGGSQKEMNRRNSWRICFLSMNQSFILSSVKPTVESTPVRVLFEPWNYEIVCSRSIYTGDEEAEIRVWGRRRLLILERQGSVVGIAERLRQLCGNGKPGKRNTSRRSCEQNPCCG